MSGETPNPIPVEERPILKGQWGTGMFRVDGYAVRDMGSKWGAGYWILVAEGEQIEGDTGWGSRWAGRKAKVEKLPPGVREQMVAKLTAEAARRVQAVHDELAAQLKALQRPES